MTGLSHSHILRAHSQHNPTDALVFIYLFLIFILVKRRKKSWIFGYLKKKKDIHFCAMGIYGIADCALLSRLV